MKKLRRTDPVADLLQTSNKKEQVAQINQLVQMANAPVLTLVITFDSRNQRVNAEQVGAEAPNEILQQVLDAAKNLFNQQEVAKQVKLASTEVPDGEPVEDLGEIPESPIDPPEDIPPDNIEGEPDAV
jgi:hypothetical protein